MNVNYLGILILALVIVIALMGAAVYFITNKRTKRIASDIVSHSQQKNNSEITRVCPNCKESIGDGMTFCMNCGTKIQ